MQSGFDLMEELGYQRGDFPNAEWVSDRTFSLPISPKMTESDVQDNLLDVLEDTEFTIREVNQVVKAEVRPVIILTSNAKRELSDPFLRRCFCHHIAFPTPEQMREIFQTNGQFDLQKYRAFLASPMVFSRMTSGPVRPAVGARAPGRRPVHRRRGSASSRHQDPWRPIPRPPWLGIEVSHESRYFNSNLAQHPYTAWRDDG